MIKIKLFAMMFLEFFIWGAWLPLIFGYLPSLGFTDLQQSLILNAFPLAAMVAMIGGNQLADRFFSAEKFLAVSHLIGGLSIAGLYWVRDPWVFFALMLIHCLFYVPTISITNSIAFAAMKDAQQEFGIVRMGGTIGWIAASWPFVFLLKGVEGESLKAATASTFMIAGIASLILAGFSLVLPHTPPKKAEEGGAQGLPWLKALSLLGLPFVLVLWLVTFVDAAVHQCYFNWTGRFLENIGIPGNWIMPVMSIGQIAEILTMAVLGFCLKSLGWRKTMIIGILGHALRFAVFAFFPNLVWLVVFVNVLHGVCYAFFFATVYIFVEEYFPKDVRSSAQGIFNLMILGIGPVVANSIGPYLFSAMTTAESGTNYQGLFLLPCLTALLAAGALAVFFWPPAKAVSEEAV